MRGIGPFRTSAGLQLEAPLTTALPHFCLNFALGPFLAWAFRKASCMPECLMFAWLLPWALDCSVLRLLGLPGACYTGAGPDNVPEADDIVADRIRMWNAVRWLSLVGLHLSLLRWLQSDSTQTRGLLFLLDRLAFGMLVASPWILRLVLFSWRDSCCEFSWFVFLAIILGGMTLTLCASFIVYVAVQEPWQQAARLICRSLHWRGKKLSLSLSFWMSV